MFLLVTYVSQNGSETLTVSTVFGCISETVWVLKKKVIFFSVVAPALSEKYWIPSKKLISFLETAY